MARTDTPDTADTRAPRSPRSRIARPLLIGATAVTLTLGGAVALAQQGLFGGGLRGAPQGPVSVDLYDVDPSSEGATPIATLELDSTADLADLAATEGASWAVVQGSFERVIDLERAAAMAAGERPDGRFGERRGARGERGMRGGHGGFGPAGAFRGAPVDAPLRGLTAGSQVTVTLYDADPAAGGSVVDTLAFTVGEDDPSAFRDALSSARSSAAWIEIDVDGSAVELPPLPGSAAQDDASQSEESSE